MTPAERPALHHDSSHPPALPSALHARLPAGLTLAIWAFFHAPSTSTFIVYLNNNLVSDFTMTLMLPLRMLTDSGLGPWQLKAFVFAFQP